MKSFIGLLGVCSMIVLWSGNTVAVVGTIFDCEVTASGDFLTAEVFVGTASSIGGVVMIDWLHITPNGEPFVTMTPDPNGIECRRNGTISADFSGAGTATFDGDPNHSYIIEIEDNRPPPDSVVLVASIAHRPTVRTKGSADFDPPRTVVIPTELSVTAGGPGRGLARLRLNTSGDDITCLYRGDGTTYQFRHCGAGFMPDDRVDISRAQLVILTADRGFVLTSVEVDIGTGDPAAGAADLYSIQNFRGRRNVDSFFHRPGRGRGHCDHIGPVAMNTTGLWWVDALGKLHL